MDKSRDTRMAIQSIPIEQLQKIVAKMVLMSLFSACVPC